MLPIRSMRPHVKLSNLSMPGMPYWPPCPAAPNWFWTNQRWGLWSRDPLSANHSSPGRGRAASCTRPDPGRSCSEHGSLQWPEDKGYDLLFQMTYLTLFTLFNMLSNTKVSILPQTIQKRESIIWYRAYRRLTHEWVLGARDIGNMVISHNIAISAAKWPEDIISFRHRDRQQSLQCLHVGISGYQVF